MKLAPFRMERWQSTYEHRVRYNLSESGVHPLALSELLELAGEDPENVLGAVRLGYGQSNGSDELREAVARLYPGATEKNVLVTVGGAEANFVSAWQLLEPGGAVAVMLPNYMQLPGILEGLGARVVPFRLREEEDWRPDLDGLERALEAGARVVVVTNPNNPLGRVLRAEEAARVVELAERHGAWILADEVYRGAEVDGPETPSFWGRTERVLLTHSLSKAYALPGLRVGWVVGPEEVVAELWGRTDYTTIAPATLSDRLAVLALRGDVRPKILERTRAIVRENLAALEEWIAGRGSRLRHTRPDAGAICTVRYDLAVESGDLAERLRVEKDVLVVPGDHIELGRCLRIGFGPPLPELREALGRLGEALDELAG